VLLPAPDGATIATISPRRKLRFASIKIGKAFAPEPYVFFRLRASRTTAASGKNVEALNLVNSGLASPCVILVGCPRPPPDVRFASLAPCGLDALSAIVVPSLSARTLARASPDSSLLLHVIAGAGHDASCFDLKQP
jgi:hypothetical protein